jgi:hypothetical protein
MIDGKRLGAFSICVNALSGTALDGVELVVVLLVVVLVDPTPEDSAFAAR